VVKGFPEINNPGLIILADELTVPRRDDVFVILLVVTLDVPISLEVSFE
jgi:hypothetical protein